MPIKIVQSIIKKKLYKNSENKKTLHVHKNLVIQLFLFLFIKFLITSLCYQPPNYLQFYFL